MSPEITPLDPRSTAAQSLLRAHLVQMHAQTPEQSVHALDSAALGDERVQLLGAWCGGQLAGCGALWVHDARLAEIKSMHTAARWRRRGVARALLARLIALARERGIAQLALETGSAAAFAPARAMYAAAGFTPCPPFADYRADPLSAYYCLALD